VVKVEIQKIFLKRESVDFFPCGDQKFMLEQLHATIVPDNRIVLNMSHTKSNKRRKLSPPEDSGRNHVQTPGAASKRSKPKAEEWDVEAAYQHRAKKQKGNETNKLPIKTSEGWVQQKEEEEASVPEDGDSFLGTDDEDEDMLEGEEEPEEPAVPPRQQILEAKEELARLAGLINEDPEEHLASLKALGNIAASRNPTVKKLALATQCAVYKDIIPGYRIRPWSEEDVSSKLSKDVRKLRAYEQALVTGYQAYVKELEVLAKGSKGYSEKEAGQLASVATTCACTLLKEVPHFNFRGDLLKILITKLSRKRFDNDFSQCLRAIEHLFEHDEEGKASMDAVSQLTKMIKARNYAVHESVLNTFLHLRLLSEFSSKASHERVDKAVPEEPQQKQSKKDRQYLTKRQRKQRKEIKKVDKEMQEANAVVSHEERDKAQAEMLKLVFATYFRILKAKVPGLMGAVLEGLARYAHLINQDFFGDILEALKDLINEMEDEAEEGEDDDEERSVRNVTRESLLCAITAFALLEGQDASKAATTLQLDLNFFIKHLYRTLHPASLNPDLELSSKSLRLADPLSSATTAPTTKVNAATTTVLLLRSLSSTLLPRQTPPLRLAAFTKQLMSVTLQLPEKSCVAMLGLLGQVSKVHGRKVAGLWNSEERRGDGVFDAERGEVEGSNPFAASVWEGELLRLHYCEKVREGVKQVERNIRTAS
jgi:nucleolar complex protein 3